MNKLSLVLLLVTLVAMTVTSRRSRYEKKSFYGESSPSHTYLRRNSRMSSMSHWLAQQKRIKFNTSYSKKEDKTKQKISDSSSSVSKHNCKGKKRIAMPDRR